MGVCYREKKYPEVKFLSYRDRKRILVSVCCDSHLYQKHTLIWTLHLLMFTRSHKLPECASLSVYHAYAYLFNSLSYF